MQLFVSKQQCHTLCYSSCLQVEIKTEETLEASNNFDEGLKNVIPLTLAEKILRREGVKPKVYPAVSVCSVGIAKFNRLILISAPAEMTQFLNDVFLLLDDVMRQFTVDVLYANGPEYLFLAGLNEESPPGSSKRP